MLSTSTAAWQRHDDTDDEDDAEETVESLLQELEQSSDDEVRAVDPADLPSAVAFSSVWSVCYHQMVKVACIRTGGLARILLDDARLAGVPPGSCASAKALGTGWA